ncbi:gliding motility-associated C-terminal domain-containing protein [Maribacter sp. ANRC-HE7]|uniref:Gliding motility-associated C-terminal domain-containing protein n=1 Tax=Maribacter aquimaris TaxID=2737171 RepID=A0ABR7V6N2_9FLAO|nr:gliding motility-associated C-terminal domain-containing protein [Maribacter aquimaris]MBD0780112.1 gliding motility-associated C-terminal domain-containing protein [Maribacter aquimaris]
MMKKLFLIVTLLFNLGVFAQDIQVSVFNYPGLNGSGGCSEENENLIDIVNAIPGYTVDGTITSFANSSTLATQLDASTFFFMTDMENQNPNNTTFFPTASHAVFENWVSTGGVMVMTGTYNSRDADFLNLIFSWDLVNVQGTMSWVKNTANTAGTPFDGVTVASLPNLSATDAISKGTVANFTTMWGTDSDAVVAVIKYGAGYVIFMGFDFYNTGPSCPQYSSDWVQQVIPAALDYATALSASTVSNTSQTFGDFEYAFSETGTTSFILVPGGSTAPSIAQIEAGVDYPGGTVLDASTVSTIGDVPYTFNLTELEPDTNYDIYVVTLYNDGSSDVHSTIANTNFTTIPNDSPEASAILNQSECINGSVSGLALTITDTYPGDNTFSVTATSSNTGIVANSDIIITGTGNTRSIAITPVLDANGTSTITVSIEDSLGEIGTQTFDATFNDSVSPTAVAQDITVQLDASGNASVTTGEIDNGSTDNCTIATYALDTTDFNCTDLGENTVTLTITDGNGNSDTATAVVTVEDSVSPTVVVQDITVQLDASGNASVTTGEIDNGSTDNCTIATYALDTTDFTCADVGENTVTLTVTDVNGNSDTATAVVTVEDSISPTVVVQDITVQLDENGLVNITEDQFITNSDDNCIISNISIDRTDFDCANLGNYTITITAMDSNGNTTVETATLTVTGDDNDGDLIADSCDTDDDNDGTPDTEDAFPLDDNEDTDTDGDGTGDNADTDDDGDGTPDTEDAFPLDDNEDTDTDGDGTGDNADTDDDNDGYSDETELMQESDSKNANDYPVDTDNDGIADFMDNDDDNDGITDGTDAFPIESTPTLVPAEAFTPNGDGINDTWMVPGIDNYPNNTVRVYNRWGHEVFAAGNYRNDWTGRHNANSTMLPTGSYLYVVDLGNGSAPLQGWIFINY